MCVSARSTRRCAFNRVFHSIYTARGVVHLAAEPLNLRTTYNRLWEADLFARLVRLVSQNIQYAPFDESKYCYVLPS